MTLFLKVLLSFPNKTSKKTMRIKPNVEKGLAIESVTSNAE